MVVRGPRGDSWQTIQAACDDLGELEQELEELAQLGLIRLTRRADGEMAVALAPAREEIRLAG